MTSHAGPHRTAPPHDGFSFIGGLLCVDFVNSEVIAHDGPLDRLGDVDDLLRWARAAGIADDAALRRLPPGWRSSRDAAQLLEEARALRAVLRAVVDAIAGDRPVPAAAVPVIDRALAAGASTIRLRRHGATFVTARELLDPSPAALLAPIAESAAWLLEHGDRALVRRCENAACIRFFYDRTKNRRRRWCAMDGCGSRAKAAAYYRRRKAGATGDQPPRAAKKSRSRR